MECVTKAAGRHKSRLVAKEFNDGVEPALCSPTPPLEALKLLIVRLAMREQEQRSAEVSLDDHNSSVMIHGVVRRPYFYAQAKPDTHVQGVQGVWVSISSNVRNEASSVSVVRGGGEVIA